MVVCDVVVLVINVVVVVSEVVVVVPDVLVVLSVMVVVVTDVLVVVSTSTYPRKCESTNRSCFQCCCTVQNHGHYYKVT